MPQPTKHVVMPDKETPSVLVLLSAYNGARYLQEQIDSILCQKDVNAFILIRDDGSTDHTLELLRQLASSKPRHMKLVEGKNVGCARSFVELMRIASTLKEFTPDYYAFSDQDDVWFPEKLSHSIHALPALDNTRPQLFSADSIMVDSNLNELPVKKRSYKFSFGEALVCNASGGHTQVFNKKLLLEAIRVDFPPVILHDWWVYCVCQALGGDFICEATPLLYYRQHTNNVVGSRNRSKSLLQKIKEIESNTNTGLSYQLATTLFNSYKGQLDKERYKILKLVVNYKTTIWNRVRLLCAFRNFRSCHWRTNIRFFISVISGKF